MLVLTKHLNFRSAVSQVGTDAFHVQTSVFAQGFGVPKCNSFESRLHICTGCCLTARVS